VTSEDGRHIDRGGGVSERSTTTIDGREVLVEDHAFSFPYERSPGPVLGRFLGGLKVMQLSGIRGSDGRVLVPPVEYDPLTSAELDEYVPVASVGVVTAWSWVEEPRAKHPLDRPFAWALILLDGADTAMLHVVAVPMRTDMATGMRVQAQWRDERVGSIGDLACFVPEGER
jgi:uncharacterized OB-fold protein